RTLSLCVCAHISSLLRKKNAVKLFLRYLNKQPETGRAVCENVYSRLQLRPSPGDTHTHADTHTHSYRLTCSVNDDIRPGMFPATHAGLVMDAAVSRCQLSQTTPA